MPFESSFQHKYAPSPAQGAHFKRIGGYFAEGFGSACPTVEFGRDGLDAAAEGTGDDTLHDLQPSGCAKRGRATRARRRAAQPDVDDPG
ncbi:protein of unknown function (plasmid) [Shinella sp. WSC3-e]|nr:hypothetical protein SHINE37_80033 [Rhizobiaceae bacterium]CAK7261957.1 protein of unknown function [Shinella sp. WSC3-e]